MFWFEIPAQVRHFAPKRDRLPFDDIFFFEYFKLKMGDDVLISHEVRTLGNKKRKQKKEKKKSEAQA